MTASRRSILAALPAGAAPFLLPRRAAAQPSWMPARPVRLVVPFTPGGTTDLLGRLAARGMEPSLGTSVVVDNRGGAGGVIGSDLVAKAVPDGYTILLSNIASQAIGPAVSKHVPYDPVRDFTPIGLIAAVPSAIVVATDGPIRSLPELVARARTGNVKFGSTGIGTSSHVKLELLNRAAGVAILHAPYRGSAPAVADVLGGQIDGLIAAVPDVGRNDRLRMLAVTTPERAARWPNVPSVREFGFETLVATNWFGLSGPAGMPDAAADALHDALAKGLSAPDAQERLLDFGAGPHSLSRRDYEALIASDVARWARVAKEAGIEAE
ncbi:tripartite tricarboxylate transporter substrate binding protein [Roseomonas sp. KE2513]|uniref:Bug family tripartite tricarboxylate transporter substrate binding protein n=1 Tax=Roseomonas sp. KE2513 TaxID=2479202 RepID=UPI0018DFDCAE|nr:tripartite tricarboxylate transporter substrate binding protein [Roseomonas sp. KE2513]MBI0534407.1 tripartite tricarboxylate transporter substrate binding protein [Roseomonas sp. KE2513]